MYNRGLRSRGFKAGDFKAEDFKAEDFRAYIINPTRVEVAGEVAESYKFPLLKHKTDIEPDSCPNKSKLFQKATHVTR